ncbi:GDT1-like protein 2, chloroplastic [Galdieria sulphuraria]|nr:GDT1-like protein 2, chloroplastic [Galdieria sulphuraria]
MASFLDSAKLFVPSQYSQSRVVGLSKQKKLENILYSKSRIRNLVIVSCSHHNRGVERETLIKPCYPKKGRLGFVSLSLRLLCLIRLSWASYRRSLSLLLPYRYSSSGLALLLSTTLRRGVFATSPFLSSLVEAMTMVFMSELGDKTLTMMTGIACFLGNLMHLLPPIYTHYGSIILFLYFGIQMIKNSYTKNQRESTELGDAEKKDIFTYLYCRMV